MNSNCAPSESTMSLKETLDRLLTQVKSPDPDERFDAAGELADYDKPEADAAVIEAAADPDPQVAALVVRKLAERGHTEARDLILGLLRRRHPEWLLQSALRSAGVVDISPHLEEAWGSLDARMWVARSAGAGALAKAGVVAAAPKIRQLALRGIAAGQRAPAAHLAGSGALLGDEESADLFLAQFTSRSRMGRIAAAAFLERRGRLEAMAEAVGIERLSAAVLAGRKIYDASPPARVKPNFWAHDKREFDKLLERLEELSERS